MKELFIAPFFLAAFGGIFSLFLAVADILLSVRRDARAEIIEKILPGLNCGACGFPSCQAYASVMASGKAAPGLCTSLDASGVEVISGIFGGLEKTGKKVAVVKCSGGSLKKFEYTGVPSCAAARLVSAGNLQCQWGCLGLGDCVEVCPAGAIGISAAGAAVIDAEKCTGCGLCVSVCPRKIIELKPVSEPYYVACSSEDRAEVRKYCKNGCFSCGICTGKKFNPDGVVEMKNNIPAVLWDRVRDAEQVRKAGEKCPVKVWKKIEIRSAQLPLSR